MPSRPTLAAILAFWFATSTFVLYRDVWPILTASSPPAIALDLADEANPTNSVKWGIYRGDKKVGKLTTKMTYIDADNTIQLTHTYEKLEFDLSGAKVLLPHLETTTRVSRTGELREQSLEGTLELQSPSGTLKAEISVRGKVVNRTFIGRCELRSSLGDIDQELEPIDVPSGQALNPLQVSNRIADLKPGQQWVVKEIDPLGEAIAALLKSRLPIPEMKRETIIARVSDAPAALPWQGQEYSCWVIDYRASKARAKTWVRVNDGKVLRQEAYREGERLAVEREE